MNETSAEAHKVAGNTHFVQGSYEEAIREYSTAIIQKPDGISYFTNRALAYLKLSRWDECILDCQKAVEIDRSSVKGHYLLGQALTKQQRYKEALWQLQKAYELSLDQTISYTSDILEAILAARRRKWEKNERQRLEQESELFQYLETLIDADRDRKLQSLEQQTEDVDDADEVNYEHDMRLTQVKSLLRQPDENHKREVPDYFCDKISFNVLVDPVITPSGVTYERESLREHFKHIGQIDPLSRTPLTENDLISNLALKEAVDDFIEKNGWALDC